MKKLIGALTTIMLLVWGGGNIQAQDWTWQAPVLILEDITPLVLDEIAADPTSGTLYGIKDDDYRNVYIIDQSLGLAARLTTDGNDGANDIAIGPYGEVYICTNTSIQVYDTSVGDFVNLDKQPETDTLEGNFVRITVGMMGMLHVLFQVGDSSVQYLLNGTLPVITEGVSISFKPRTLNLKSRGKWVSCHIGLPDGYAVGDIVPSSVEITEISIEGVAQPVGPIGVPDDAPLPEVEDGKLKVKFTRLHVITAIGSLLSGNEGKFVKVTLTVHGSVKVNEQYFDFEGTDTIKVKTGQKKK